MKNALVTLNINDFLRDNSRASFVAAARRWDCDYIEITESDELFPHAMKLKVFDICDADRVFYVDADAIISAGCPSPFETFSEDIFVACNNQQEQMSDSCRRACADNIARDLNTINEITGGNIPNYVDTFINSGVWMASRKKHKSFLERVKEIAIKCHGETEWMDQSAFNYALIESGTPIHFALPTWNYQFPPDSGAGPMEEYIYHWAGGENREQIDKINWRSFRATKIEQITRKPRLLWIGDACCDTGFARVTHSILKHLQAKWDITVIGINYQGNPHSYSYPIYPASIGGDLWGFGKLNQLIGKINPTIICVLNDPWIVGRFATEIQRGDTPMLAYIPIDAKNQNPYVCNQLNGLDRAVFYTKFGEAECRIAGYKGESGIIPHGVDTNLYRPIDRQQSRARMDITGLPDDAFIVGNVNRNSPRKRLDLSIQYFAEWLRQRAGAPDRIMNAYLYLHCSQNDTAGLPLAQIANYYGVSRRLIIPDDSLVTPAKGLPEDQMPYVYNSFDVQLSTTVGEGWGLCQIEGAACGIPQIVPQSSGLSEWIAGASWMVPCTASQAHPVIGTIGAIPDRAETIKALDLFYRSKELRVKYGDAALERARCLEYRWEKIAKMFNEQMNRAIFDARARAVQREIERKEKNAEIQEAERIQQAV